MTDETPIPWHENERARLVFALLNEGPRTTVELQRAPLVHVARQIWELRHWYGHAITTKRLKNRVALYTLTGSPVEAGIETKRQPRTPVIAPVPASTRVPVFGDTAAIREMRR